MTQQRISALADKHLAERAHEPEVVGHIYDVPVFQWTPTARMQAGVWTGMPNDVYHRTPGISKTGLDLIRKSPAHFYMQPAQEQRPAFKMGAAMHMALLEPDLFDETYTIVDSDSIASKEANIIAAAVADAKGIDPSLAHMERVKAAREWMLKQSDVADILGMQASVRSCAAARPFFDTKERYTEISFFIEMGECDLGIMHYARCRFDVLAMVEGQWSALDVKTTVDADPRKWGRHAEMFRYHVQEAFYSWVFQKVTGQPLGRFRFLAIEKTPYHGTRLFKIPDEAVAVGTKLGAEDLATWRDTFRDPSTWRGYDNDNEVEALFPRWTYDDADDEEAADE